MIQLKQLRLVCVIFLLYLLTACSSSDEGGSNNVQLNLGSTSDEPNAELLPSLKQVTALSEHYIQITFDEEADPIASGNPLNYTITLSNGHVVPVTAATASVDKKSALLEITPSDADKLLVPGGAMLLDLVNINDEPIAFIGSSTPEPAVKSVYTLSATSILVTFTEPMSDNAADIGNYRISYDNGSSLEITDAALGNFGESVLLTTAPQSDVTYTITFGSISSKVSSLPLYPSSSGTTFLGNSPIPPRVVGAISTDNTHVTVTFSKPMGAEAETATNYFIVQENVNSEAGMLGVVDSHFISADQTAVELTTRSQNELTYRVTVVNVKDTFGQQFDLVDGLSGLLSATSATFAGTPPGANELIDSDGDGIYDNEEQAGYNIFIELANGEVVVRQVTSDPINADTDGDGLDDSVELQYGTNPRATDTDGDSLSDALELNTIYSDPFAQDTDLDSLRDGYEHFDLHTSPLLADSDGDMLSDSAELFELNRDPLIADLPKVSITVGDVRLQIDERYTYTDESGTTVTQESSSNATLSNSQNSSYTQSAGHVTEWTVGGSLRAGIGDGSFFGGSAGLTGGAELTVSGGYTDTTSMQVDATSASEAQQVYEHSQSKGRELTSTSTVTREVVGARIDVDLSVENVGNVPFTLSNLEVTVLEASPIDSRKLVPVATLVANSELITGTPLVVNMGPFNSKRGPFLFANREVFPNLVEALMRNPRGLIFKVANYDVSDELGRNFAFSNQLARDRTAGVVFDFGDAASAEHHYVATSGALDDAGATGGDGRGYVGGFAANGQAVGLPLDYILQARLGLKRHDTSKNTIVPGPNGVLDTVPLGDDILADEAITTGPNGWMESSPLGDDYVTNPTVQDGIVAGLNQSADSIAQGDDIQLVPVGTTGLSVGTVVIGAGENGMLDTPALVDDRPDFVTGYETSRSCSALSNKAGDICRIASDCACQPGDQDARCLTLPAPAPEGSCSGPQRLTRINSLRNGDYNRAWFVLTSGELPAAADFGQITVRPGEDIAMAFLQDLDRDGLFAREEFLANSTDSASDNLPNSSFGVNFDESSAVCSAPLSATACDGLADSRDSDRDGLGDYAEARIGWKVAADGGALRQVYSSPALRDSDGDGLLDPQERDLRNYCLTNDPRKDGLCAFLYQPAVTQAQAIGIIAGPDGVAQSSASGDDIQLVAVNTTGLAYGTPVVSAGLNGSVDTPLSGDDRYESLNTVPPATDPSQGDSDLDNVTDFTELNGYLAGLAIIDGGNGVADSARNGDDVQKVPQNHPITAGGIVILPGANGTIDSVAQSDDQLRLATTVKSDPLRRDTDNDTNPDGLEITLGSDPTIADGADFRDSDRDGLTDNEESALGWTVTVAGAISYTVKSSPSLPDTDSDGLPDLIERELRTDPNKADTDGDGISDYDEAIDFERFVRLLEPYPNAPINGSGSARYGTNPLNKDSDGDALSDYQELIDGFRLTLPGDTAPRLIFTSPLLADSDGDGRSDKDEVDRMVGSSEAPTDPTNNDTDGDGRSDGVETVSDPRVPDITYRVITRYVSSSGCDEGGNGTGDLAWWFVLHPASGSQSVLLSDAYDVEAIPAFDTSVSGVVYRGAVIYMNDTNYESVADTIVNGVKELQPRPDACYAKLVGNPQNFLNFNKSSGPYPLKQGESIRLQALATELDGGDVDVTKDCGVAPNYIPNSFTAHDTIYLIDKTFFYSDLAGSDGISLTNADAQPLLGPDECKIDFKIDIEVN